MSTTTTIQKQNNLTTEREREREREGFNHEQHIRVASCRSRLETPWGTPTSTPRGAHIVGAIELKIGSID